mgnify:CR=1 FL=1
MAIRVEAKIENLKDLRVMHGLTLTEAAARMGISASCLSNIENGKTGINIDRASQIARLYNSDLNSVYRLYIATKKRRKKKYK